MPTNREIANRIVKHWRETDCCASSACPHLADGIVDALNEKDIEKYKQKAKQKTITPAERAILEGVEKVDKKPPKPLPQGDGFHLCMMDGFGDFEG